MLNPSCEVEETLYSNLSIEVNLQEVHRMIIGKVESLIRDDHGVCFDFENQILEVLARQFVDVTPCEVELLMLVVDSCEGYMGLKVESLH